MNQIPRTTHRGKIALAGFVIALLLGAAGLWLWNGAGAITLSGTLKGNAIILTAPRGGTLLTMEAREGQMVQKGQIVARLDTSALEMQLLQERQKLSDLESLLPPEHLGARPSGAAAAEPPATLTERHATERRQEDDAARILQDATDREARAAVVYSRATALAARGKISRERKDAAEAALADARADAARAKAHFEEQSLARAGTGVEIKRVRDYQATLGADQLPVQKRLDEYAVQRDRVEAIASALQASQIVAPEDGLVTTVLVKAGQNVEAGKPGLIMVPASDGFFAVADVDAATAARLVPGQQCLVESAGAVPDGQGFAVAGVVRAVRSLALASPDGQSAPGAPAYRVWVALAPGQGGTAGLLDGTETAITVYLREPLLAETGQTGDTGRITDQKMPPEAPALGAPPEGTLDVRGQGGLYLPDEPPAPVDGGPHKPVVVITGSPEAEGRAPEYPAAPQAPQRGAPPEVNLPEMKAPPYPPQGSPLPDPANNPSIVPPHMVDDAKEKP